MFWTYSQDPGIAALDPLHGDVTSVYFYMAAAMLGGRNVLQ